MDSPDVAIVGGGPAGSTVARQLRAAGLDVVVLDRAEFPRHKVCAGWITPAVLRELELSEQTYTGDGRTLQPITGFRVGTIGGSALDCDYGETISYGIRRCELDDFLLRRSGARLQLGQPLRSLERTDHGWLLNGQIRTPLVIGAGGHGCPVARHLGAASEPLDALVVAQEVELRLDEKQALGCRVRPETPELYFTPDLKGYGWCFRKGDFLNVGLGRLDRSGLKGHVRDFVDRLRRAGRLSFELEPAFQGHAYLVQSQTRRQVAAAGCLLVGDAAGLAYPTSGEGIRPAVESALLAARVVLDADGSYSAERLERYARLLDARFGGSGPSVARFLPERWRHALAGRLLRAPWFVRQVVLDRWFLHRKQPVLGPDTLAAA